MEIKSFYFISISFILLSLISAISVSSSEAKEKKRILVVSSYHKEYAWSKETNEGLCSSLMKFGYFDNKKQVDEYTRNDYAETSKMVIKKVWMDAKRKTDKQEKIEATARITRVAKELNPDMIMLGDDDAGQYIGPQFLDTTVPIVFWGINNTPVKYGLVDSIDKPGHNATGIYQSGYYAESIILLKKIAPKIKTFAILTDDTSTGRSHQKAIEALARETELPVKWVESFATSDFSQWKKKALELQKKVDAFFIAQYSALKDEAGKPVPPEEVAKWYTAHIKVPEATNQDQFVKQGMLSCVNDSAFNQGYEAGVVANDILTNGANPATYPARAPKPGGAVVNKARAKGLGIELTDKMGIDQLIDQEK